MSFWKSFLKLRNSFHFLASLAPPAGGMAPFFSLTFSPPIELVLTWESFKVSEMFFWSFSNSCLSWSIYSELLLFLRFTFCTASYSFITHSNSGSACTCSTISSFKPEEKKLKVKATVSFENVVLLINLATKFVFSKQFLSWIENNVWSQLIRKLEILTDLLGHRLDLFSGCSYKKKVNKYKHIN